MRAITFALPEKSAAFVTVLDVNVLDLQFMQGWSSCDLGLYSELGRGLDLPGL